MKKRVEEITEETIEVRDAAENHGMRSVAGIFFVVLSVAVAVVCLAGDMVSVLVTGKMVLKLALGSCWPVLVILLAIVGTIFCPMKNMVSSLLEMSFCFCCS